MLKINYSILGKITILKFLVHTSAVIPGVRGEGAVDAIPGAPRSLGVTCRHCGGERRPLAEEGCGVPRGVFGELPARTGHGPVVLGRAWSCALGTGVTQD